MQTNTDENAYFLNSSYKKVINSLLLIIDGTK